MLTYRPQPCPMRPEHDLNKKTTPVSKENGDLYRSRVVSLLYLATKLRPDLWLISSTLGSHVVNATDVQLKGVKRALR